MTPLVIFLLLSVSICRSQVPLSDSESPKAIRFLALVQWQDELGRPHSGWDAGPDMLAAGRVAVKEVNNRSDILPGYTLEMIEGRHEACGLTEANLGIRDLVQHGINPPNRTVVAVLGLFCSTSAQIIAPIAGRAELIQLSAANSAIFTKPGAGERFPHLWRILVSANVYADTVLALVRHYGWTRIGVIQDFETIYHSGIAETFLALITRSNTSLEQHVELSYHGGLVQTRDSLVNNSLDSIKDKGARIIFLQTTGPQTSKFLCSAALRGMVYPDYLWIITDFFLSGLIDELEDLSDCNEELLRKGANGSLVGFFDLEPNINATLVNASGEPYSEYQRKYFIELEQTRQDHYDTGEVRGDVLYAGLLYDQVWSLALALHDVTSNTNISIDNYTFNQPETTRIIEESLSRVSFIGATGHIRFSANREVQNPVKLYQIDSSLENDSDILIGIYEPLTDRVDIYTNVHLPPDRPEVHVIYLPTYGAVLLYLATLAVVIFVTVILTFLLYHRSKPQIKASSPILSLIMFIGCYFLCGACILLTTNISFGVSDGVFEFLCNTESILVFNGLSLIFVTLFIKLLRIHKIFNNKGMQYLGWIWDTSFLTIMVITITTIPNIILLVWLSVDRLQRRIRQVSVTTEPLIYEKQYHLCSSKYLGYWYGLAGVYISFILILVVILAARTRRIKHRNFKDTKKVNIFIFLFTLTFTISIFLFFIFPELELIRVGQILFTVGLLVMVCQCQIMLFLPKIITFRMHNAGHHTLTGGFLALFLS